MSGKIVCVGSALVDELYFCEENTIAGTSNPATMQKNVGGVISNIAQHLALLGNKVELITVFGDDSDGKWIENEFINAGIEVANSLKVRDTTGKYVSILSKDGSLFTAACVDICARYLTPSFLSAKTDCLLNADIIVADTNIDSTSLQWLASFARKHQIPLIIEPVSVAKARKIAHLEIEDVFMLTPNEDELFSLCNKKHSSVQDAINELFYRDVNHVWLRKGDKGSVIHTKTTIINLSAATIDIQDTTGAGDAALAGWITGYVRNLSPEMCLQMGHTLAFEVLQIKGAVKKDINYLTLLESLKNYYPDAK